MTRRLKKAIAEITPSLLVETIDEMLLVQRGKELGYKMTDEDFNRVVTRIRTDNKLDTDEAFHAALKQEGMSMADLRSSLEKQMLVTRVQQAEVMGKISITEEEARKYHAEHVKDFTRPGEVTIREIQFAVAKSDKGINVGLDDEARTKAEERAQADLRRRSVRAGGRRAVRPRRRAPTAAWSGRSTRRN